MQRRDPKPEVLRLEELAIAVKSGSIKLPKFQRQFVWKKSDILKLLDSIYRGYPIGSLLIWNSSQRLSSERSILGLVLSDNNKYTYPTDYLLDGQQRLTALCGALYWEGGDPSSIWNIQFDLDREEFIYERDLSKQNNFPLNRLIDTSDFIKQCMRLGAEPRGSIYIDRAERLLRSIKDYKIAVVRIGDMTIEEVAPIFERINSTGRKLTIVDLMVAATWSNGFDLNDVINGIADDVRESKFGDVKDKIILRSISAGADGGVSKEDIQRLRKLDQLALQRASDKVRTGVRHTIDFLKEKINIHDFSKIPYGFQFTYLVEYFRIAERSDPAKEEELARWFWYTSATRYFATNANTGQIGKDLNFLRSFAQNPITELYDRRPIDITRLIFDKFNLRNSTSASFTLLLGMAGPRETVDGRPIENDYLSIKDSRLYSPLFKRIKSNISQVIHPFSSILDAAKLTVANGHLLNDECIYAISKDDTDSFIRARANIVREFVGKLTQCEIQYRIEDLDADALNTFDEDDEEDI